MANYKWTFPSGMIDQINNGNIQLSPAYTPNYTTSDGGFSVTVNDGATATAYTLSCMTEDGSCSTTGTLTIKDCGGGDCDERIKVSKESGPDIVPAEGGTLVLSHGEVPPGDCDERIKVSKESGPNPVPAEGGTLVLSHGEVPPPGGECQINELSEPISWGGGGGLVVATTSSDIEWTAFPYVSGDTFISSLYQMGNEIKAVAVNINYDNRIKEVTYRALNSSCNVTLTIRQQANPDVQCEVSGLTIPSSGGELITIAELTGYEGSTEDIEFECDCDWLRIIFFSEGTDNITAMYVSANTSGEERSVEITIHCNNDCGCDGKPFTVTQQA